MTNEEFRHYKQLPEIQFNPNVLVVDEAKEALSHSELFCPEIQSQFNFKNSSNELIENFKKKLSEIRFKKETLNQ